MDVIREIVSRVNREAHGNSTMRIALHPVFIEIANVKTEGKAVSCIDREISSINAKMDSEPHLKTYYNDIMGYLKSFRREVVLAVYGEPLTEDFISHRIKKILEAEGNWCLYEPLTDIHSYFALSFKNRYDPSDITRLVFSIQEEIKNERNH